MRKNIVITGIPHSGKSTFLKNIIQKHNDKVGFVTNEIRTDGERVGFEIETHTGSKTLLAHVDFETGVKVSRYGVNVGNLDTIIPLVENFGETSLLYLDEIGQMELFSEKFKQLVLEYLNAKNTCLVTLTKVFSDTFTKQLGQRSDIILVEIDEESRQAKQTFVEELLRKIDKAKRYLAQPSRFSSKESTIFLESDHDTRQLTKSDAKWICRCTFFHEYGVCSHIIAAEEYMRINE